MNLEIQRPHPELVWLHHLDRDVAPGFLAQIANRFIKLVD